jgi:hypothetical protein
LVFLINFSAVTIASSRHGIPSKLAAFRASVLQAAETLVIVAFAVCITFSKTIHKAAKLLAQQAAGAGVCRILFFWSGSTC